jgi:hypothetical protein
MTENVTIDPMLQKVVWIDDIQAMKEDSILTVVFGILVGESMWLIPNLCLDHCYMPFSKLG